MAFEWGYIIARMKKKPVRVLYCVPGDRQLNASYAAAIESAVRSVQQWFTAQLGGVTFWWSRVETVRLPAALRSSYYEIDSWDKVIAATATAFADFRLRRNDFVWVIYADVMHACNAPGRLGQGMDGICILPRQDIESLLGAPDVDDCGQVYNHTHNQHLGGLAHEIGHAFGLDHPAYCGTADETLCDWGSLMYIGYLGYPNCYLSLADEAELLAHPSFVKQPGPTFSGYREIDFSLQNGMKLTVEFRVENGELACEFLDAAGSKIDFSGNEGSQWLWHFMVQNGSMLPRSYDKI